MNTHPEAIHPPKGSRSNASRRGWWRVGLLMCLFGNGLAAGGPSGQTPRAAPTTSTQVILLTEAVAEVPRTDRARGIFVRRTVQAILPVGRAWLASSPDGTGPLCTDDQAHLAFQLGDQEIMRWSHRFSSPNRRMVDCVPPQPLDIPVAGDYDITVVLEDLYPDTSSSRPYYLIAAVETAPDVANQAADTPHPTVAAPTLAPGSPSSRSTTIQGLPAGVTTKPATTATPPAPAATAVRVSSGSAPATSAAPSLPLAPVIAVVVGGLLLGGVAAGLAWRRRRRSRSKLPALEGIIYLVDQETHGAQTIFLQQIPHGGTICRRPLGVGALSPADTSGDRIARIEPGPSGPILIELRADAGSAEPVALEHGRTYQLHGGAVSARYHHPRAGGAGLAGGRGSRRLNASGGGRSR